MSVALASSPAMCPDFAFTSDSINFTPLATGASSGLTPLPMRPTTTMPVSPRLFGSLPQLPSSFCDFLKNATAFSTVVLYCSAAGCAPDSGSSTMAAPSAIRGTSKRFRMDSPPRRDSDNVIVHSKSDAACGNAWGRHSPGLQWQPRYHGCSTHDSAPLRLGGTGSLPARVPLPRAGKLPVPPG